MPQAVRTSGYCVRCGAMQHEQHAPTCLPVTTIVWDKPDQPQDTTWFWRIVDEAGLADLPSDEEAALRLLCKRAHLDRQAEKHRDPLNDYDPVF